MRVIVFSVVTLSTINSCFSLRVGSCIYVTAYAPSSLATPSVTAWALLGFALRDSAGGAQGIGRRARGAARSRVGPPASVTPAAPSDPERR